MKDCRRLLFLSRGRAFVHGVHSIQVVLLFEFFDLIRLVKQQLGGKEEGPSRYTQPPDNLGTARHSLPPEKLLACGTISPRVILEPHATPIPQGTS